MCSVFQLKFKHSMLNAIFKIVLKVEPGRGTTEGGQKNSNRYSYV